MVRVEGVRHRHGTAMITYVPLVWVRAGHRDFGTVCTRGPEVVHVLRKLVERISAGGTPAHAQLQRGVSDVGPGHGHFSFVMGPILE